jgi:hypothetical protein
MNGWVKLHRKMSEHPVWQLTEGQFKVWIACLLLANHKEAEWWDGEQRVTIPAGSFITSQEHLAKHARVSRKTVRGAIQGLIRLGSIWANIRANRWTQIDLVNWPLYQGDESEQGQAEGQARANRGPTQGHNVRMKEGKKKITPANGLPPGFAAWWSEYPKKVGKTQAVTEWEKLNPDETLQSVMLDAIRKQKRTVKAMVENDAQHILDPERWLKYRRWEDEVSSGSVGPQAQYPRL